ncbi:hypothetical protein [Polaribacter cellanae]|uniref:Uncharacterized protein n=1 Tax=Polaribacter cellanae TaxID=2818493 RepID=A0A975CP50_9FLAO|nr:hypothetical protein [Polaribacter cellanae]QTE23541.1 hypothetical protein J3359_04460 [Polaribacter cellanae]
MKKLKTKKSIISIATLAIAMTFGIMSSNSLLNNDGKNDVFLDMLSVSMAQAETTVKTNCYAGNVITSSYYPTCKPNCPYEYMGNPAYQGKCTVTA